MIYEPNRIYIVVLVKGASGGGSKPRESSIPHNIDLFIQLAILLELQNPLNHRLDLIPRTAPYNTHSWTCKLFGDDKYN